VRSRVRELRIIYTPSTWAGPLPRVSRPADAATLLGERLAGEAVEVCVILLLTAKHRLIGCHEVGRGTLDRCVVHPRDVLKAALLANASGVIVGHNHPSGDPTPSPDDVILCTRLRAAGDILGINTLDFIIIGGRKYYSFQEAGR
jgi:DNA repair protein RadC